VECILPVDIVYKQNDTSMITVKEILLWTAYVIGNTLLIIGATDFVITEQRYDIIGFAAFIIIASTCSLRYLVKKIQESEKAKKEENAAKLSE